jgi:hypothetical protein
MTQLASNYNLPDSLNGRTSLNILLCVIKNSGEVPNFPKGIFYSLMAVVLKVNQGSKNKSIKLISLIMIKYLIKRGAANEHNF